MRAGKEEVIQNKKRAIKKLNGLLEDYINSGKEELVKKADLISYWLKTYADYIEFEDKFDSRKLMNYSRGDVIRVNFGFNIGAEMGGLHFAVVLDNDSKQKSNVLTVVPLSSTNGKTVHEREVDLGVEIFEKVNAIQGDLIEDLQNEIVELEGVMGVLDSVRESVEYGTDVLGYRKKLLQKLERLHEERHILERNDKEISKMKSGTKAVVNQITTVSKQRIYTPKKKNDFLYGVRISTGGMEKINNRLMELYCK
jgi:mRNA-degrading endonuclease toxin of MazEF toxin-antitoxin module